MSLVVSLAEAINLGLSTVAGTSATSLRDKLTDRSFRNSVVDALQSQQDDSRPSAARRLLRSREFLAWLEAGGHDDLGDYISDSQLAALGTNDSSISDLGEAIGGAIAAVAFRTAGWIEKELLRGNKEGLDVGYSTLHYLEDIWKLMEGAPETKADKASSRIVFPQPPAVVASFTGREEERARALRSIRTPSSTAACHIIFGLGGVGKSQLAAAVVSELRADFDVVCWFNGALDLTGDLAKLGMRLGVEDTDPSALAERVLEALATSARSVLVVLDDVENPAVLQKFPVGPNLRVLVTSRRSDLSGFGPTTSLGVFDRDQSLAYLQSFRIGGDEQADAVAELLGDLPLALSHAGAYCTQNGTDLSNYAKRVSDLPSRKIFEDNLDAFYKVVVHRTWQVSVSHLTAPARQMLGASAFLESSGISVEPFTNLVEDDLESDPRGAASELVRWSLASWSPRGLISMHQLLQKVVRDDEEQGGDLAAAIDYLTASLPSNRDDPASWILVPELHGHCISLLRFIDDFLVHPDRIADLDRAANEVVVLAQRAGLAALSIELGEVATASPALLRDADLDDIAATKANLAISLWSDRRFAEAIEIEEQILQHRVDTLGHQHPRTLKALINLAASYDSVGRTHEALAMKERVTQQLPILLGDQNEFTLTAWSNLATSYYGLDRIGEAIAIQERVARHVKVILPEVHQLALAARANLSESYLAAGRIAEALILGERISRLREQSFIAGHPDVISSWAHLARSYLAVGRPLDAIVMLQRCVDQNQDVGGSTRRGALLAQADLAAVYPSVGRLRDGIDLLAQVVPEAERLLGTNEQRVQVAAANLLTMQGQWIFDHR